MEQLNVRISEQKMNAVKALRYETGMSMTAIVNTALDEFFERRGLRNSIAETKAHDTRVSNSA